MIFSDTIIEGKKVFLRNLNVNDLNTTLDAWSSASSAYGFYHIPYEVPLGAYKKYYVRYTYKFTTTNLSPTWVQMYSLNGSAHWGAGISNPVAGTEYTRSNIAMPNLSGSMTLTSGTMYNGASNAIAGVSAQVKNVLVYDVTELYTLLREYANITTDALMKTWCDNNLTWLPRYTNYDVTSLITATINKVGIKAGDIVAGNFIEPDGMRAYSYSDALRDNTYFDNAVGVSIYNNKGGGTVTHTRVSASALDSPFYPIHSYILQITTNGTASPGAGGFVASHTSSANKIFVEKFVAKVPVGYTVYAAYNSQGTGASVQFISPQAGTGDWAEYTILYKCGSEGSFSTGGHVYISGSNNTSVTWYLAYANNCDITGNEYLKNYSVLGNVERIKGDAIFSRLFDTMNLLPAGNGKKQEASFFTNSNWTYDTTDVVGNAVASIVQPVNAGASCFGPRLKVRPGERYKLSYWVKCKGDMSSFLTAIRVFSGTLELSHANVNYKPGTKTLLTVALNPGDIQMVVKSNANWGPYSYSRLGFRSSSSKTYNNVGLSAGYNGSTGLISGVSGSTIVTFNTAYTGTTIPVNTYVVESFDGGTYPYPIGKSTLPTDNTWKYVEGYFGSNTLWDGAGANWNGGLPAETTEIQLYLNIYANNGTVPIKFSDIRIEPVSVGSGDRYENKILIIGGI